MINLDSMVFKSIKEKAQLGEVFELLALDEKIYTATDNMVQNYLLKETLLPYNTKRENCSFSFT